jgi:error-prone DNA polymerase
LDYRPDKFDLVIPTIKADLPPLDPLEQTVWEYELMGLSPSTHIVMHYREALRAAGIRSTWEVKHLCEAGQRVRVAGMVVVRQRPGTAKGMTFLSLEDESGLLDVVIRPDVYAKVRDTLRSNILVIADGVVQRSHSERSGSVSVLLYQLSPLR